MILAHGTIEAFSISRLKTGIQRLMSVRMPRVEALRLPRQKAI